MIKFLKKIFGYCKCINDYSSTSPSYDDIIICKQCNKKTCHHIESSYEHRDKKYICKCCNSSFTEKSKI